MSAFWLVVVVLCAASFANSQVCMGPGAYGAIFNKCYYFMATQLSYREAEYVCSGIAKSGRLVSIHSAFEQTFVYSSARQRYALNDYWIGMDDIDEAGVWAWTDDDPTPYVNWNKGGPASNTNFDCVASRINNGLWYNTRCDTKKYFVCEMDPTEVAYKVDGKVCAGRGEYSPYTTKKCLYFFNSMQTYKEAQTTCLGVQGLLVNEDTQQKEKFVSKKAQQNMRDDVWIGLSAPYGDGVFEWSNTVDVLYTHWDAGNPVNNSNANCVASLSSNTRWHNMDCDTETRPFICEVDQINATDVPDESTTQWIYYPKTRSLYYPLPTPHLNKSDAFDSLETRCNALGGESHLASIHSDDEDDIVYALAYPHSPNMMLGLRTLGNGSVVFTWVDSTPSDYTKLSPSSYGDCAYASGLYNQHWCLADCDEDTANRHYSGVCKKPWH